MAQHLPKTSHTRSTTIIPECVLVRMTAVSPQTETTGKLVYAWLHCPHAGTCSGGLLSYIAQRCTQEMHKETHNTAVYRLQDTCRYHTWPAGSLDHCARKRLGGATAFAGVPPPAAQQAHTGTGSSSIPAGTACVDMTASISSCTSAKCCSTQQANASRDRLIASAESACHNTQHPQGPIRHSWY